MIFSTPWRQILRIQSEVILQVQHIDGPNTVTLFSWHVFEVKLPNAKAKTWHLCGFRGETGNGKVSSPISAIDPEFLRCLTRSGQIYELQGAPGTNSDALAAKGLWLHINRVQEERDVTPEFLSLKSSGA